MTRYIVLRAITEGMRDIPEGWAEVREVEAASAAAAVRVVAESTEAPAGEYVAVPLRSWKPVTVTRVQTTTVRIGVAS